jgi:hypothetical protein
MLEAERLAKEAEVAEAVTEGLANLADSISITELPELQEIVQSGLANGTLEIS